ncbi:Transcriptional regulator of ribosomal biogenesis proteins [Apophysomyces sp. BC1034]|nr:Transcriptional regulator of ribosomal biogenesis protein [Apophysomyces sp. BC1015]KAG0176148.1 Transcriptional regulator of ribosomal biogenesis protein [Apophysomyces sp. BC1021]KAG0186359.1 Transcriptional regulator of ribosomal biogenesis proteins [Apophysomyces sp. BC1034]
MPVPIDYNPLRRMSTITVPKQDINFDAYDFQLCQPQTDVKGAFESRELEASFCRDFACCGLVLQDLHDLLQHYEECHVRFEDDDGSFYDESDGGYWSSSPSSPSPSAPGSPLMMSQEANISALKKKAAAYLSDLYNAGTTNPSASLLSVEGLAEEDEEDEEDEAEEEKPAVKKALSSASSSSLSSVGKKRSYTQMASPPSALDLLTQSAVKKLALAAAAATTTSTTSGGAATGDVLSSQLTTNTASILTDEDFLAQAGALLASANTNANVDKPYKCPVAGCDKAYKNPNGLKYHNQHGHCNLVSDESETIASKPYQCTIGDCGKRYKNLNGLKYHIEHSHMAALNHTLATFGSSLFQDNTSPIIQEASLPALF